MSDTSSLPQRVVPAQLGFLAIYNPSLGTTDDTLESQIVYYSSPELRDPPRKRDPNDHKSTRDVLREQKNEQLRQVGLAQGMIEFSRSFADGRSVDTVDTVKSRIILHELEAGWWILASINLTILPVTSKAPAAKGAVAEEQPLPEYSSREVKPSILLLQDLLQAHSTFLLHNAPSMDALFARTKRPKLVGMLSHYWDTFLSTWTVLMSGNPANDLYRGIKIAACGELGMGVGEEERGSGEREVLEGFVGRIDGLLDVVVCKFDDRDPSHESETYAAQKQAPQEAAPSEPWLGSGDEPAAEDGAIFLGVGALSRKSLRDLSHWVEDLYRWGPNAYGVTNGPPSKRRTKESKVRLRNGRSPEPQKRSGQESLEGKTRNDPQLHLRPRGENSMRIIPPAPFDEPGNTGGRNPNDAHSSASREQLDGSANDSLALGNNFVQYLKLGYGTHWSLGGSSSTDKLEDGVPATKVPSTASARDVLTTTTSSNEPTGLPTSVIGVRDDSVAGHYLIGLLGDINEERGAESPANTEGDDPNPRLSQRTLNIELDHHGHSRVEEDNATKLTSIYQEGTPNTHDSEPLRASNTLPGTQNRAREVRVVVYANKPFIFVLLFELETTALTLPSLYRSLHHQIGPLIKPLLSSTTFRASKPDIGSNGRGNSNAPIYDLVWDPRLLTITSTIPSIPDPYQAQSRARQPSPWSRIEALNTHMQIVNTHIATTYSVERERTCKTSRGWWVVWTRVLDAASPTTSLASGRVRPPERIDENIDEENAESRGYLSPSLGTSRRTSTSGVNPDSERTHPFPGSPSTEESRPKGKEIFLIRRASDNISGKLPNRFMSGSSGGGDVGWVAGPGKLAQGIGVDTKRYIEGLLNLNR